MSGIFIIPTNTCFGIGCFIKDLEGYNNIYKIKGRNFNKPISIFVDSIEYLEKNTKLTTENIKFLENYENPWTVLINIEDITDKNLLYNISKLQNNGIYKKIAFRISHTQLQQNLIKENGIFFLTSLNNSGEKEILKLDQLPDNLKQKLEKYNVKVLDKNIYSKQSFSDIIEFKDNENVFLRKKA